ncbi:MAG: hypothetical protein KKA05_12065, partial [Alphaproteobacteria bacterium]|nr:hypothetical protein [Alphaproteobacteria bacterium]
VLSQSVKNHGTIIADNGAVLLSAAGARGMVDALVSNSGSVRAAAGAIKMVANTIENTGTLQVDSTAANTDGGAITILADKITIGDGSRITATGDRNGGQILIGGDYQGGGGLPTSDDTYIADDVILNAGSRRLGNGGRIIVWSDENTQFLGHAAVAGGVDGGDGGLIEVSGKEYLNFSGTVDMNSVHGNKGTLLLDPTNITISAGANAQVTGASPFMPDADNATSILNATTLLSALASGNVIVQTRATGAQLGNITVDSALTWVSGHTLTLDAHNQIIVNQAISGGGLHMIAGGDVQLNANIGGTGILTIEQNANGVTMGIGASSVGLVNLNAADLTRIQDGWSDIILGRATSTAAMDIRASTWNDRLTLRNGTGTITVNGLVNSGANDMTVITDGDINLPSASSSLRGTATLNLMQANASTNVGWGGSAGALNLTATEAARVTSTWTNVNLGRTDGTGTVTANTATWSDSITIMSGTGLINVIGVQRVDANNMSFITDGDIAITPSNALYGSLQLSFSTVSAGTSIGLGDGQVGTLNLTTAEVGRIRNGWTSIVFGRTDGAADINAGTLTWNDPLTLQTGTGDININGTPTMAGNGLTLSTDGGDINVDAAISLTTGSLNFSTAGGDIIIDAAITATTTGAWSMNSGGGDLLVNSLITRTGGATSLNAGAGQLTLAAGMVLGAGALTLITDSDLSIGGNISGTSALS